MSKKKQLKISNNPSKLKVKTDTPIKWCGNCTAEYGKCSCPLKLRD